MAGAYLDQFLRRRSSQPIFVKEVSRSATGQPNYHTTNTANVGDFHEIVTVEPIDLSQSLNFSDITEIGDQLLNMRSVLNYAERSDNSFEVLMKLDSSQSAPAEDFLLEGLFGQKTGYTGNFVDYHADPAGGTSVNATEYSFKYNGSTFQMSQIIDNYMLKVANGSYVSGGSMEISREGAFSTTFNTRSSQIRFAGSSIIVDIATATNEVDITNGQYAVFVGMQFQVMDSDGKTWDEGTAAFSSSAGTVYKVASMNGNVATITKDDGTAPTLTTLDTASGADWNTSLCVVPFIHTNDTASTKVKSVCGEVVPQGAASIFLGDKDITMAQLFAKTAGEYDNQFLGSAFSMTVEKNLGDPGVQELNGAIYPAPVYVAQDYSVTGSMSMVVRPKEAYRLNKALDDFEQSMAVVIAPSTLPGRKIILFMPRVRLSFSSQDIEGAEGASIDWMLTRPADCGSDADTFKFVVI